MCRCVRLEPVSQTKSTAWTVAACVQRSDRELIHFEPGTAAGDPFAEGLGRVHRIRLAGSWHSRATHAPERKYAHAPACKIPRVRITASRGRFRTARVCAQATGHSLHASDVVKWCSRPHRAKQICAPSSIRLPVACQGTCHSEGLAGLRVATGAGGPQSAPRPARIAPHGAPGKMKTPEQLLAHRQRSARGLCHWSQLFKCRGSRSGQSWRSAGLI